MEIGQPSTPGVVHFTLIVFVAVSIVLGVTAYMYSVELQMTSNALQNALADVDQLQKALQQCREN